MVLFVDGAAVVICCIALVNVQLNAGKVCEEIESQHPDIKQIVFGNVIINSTSQLSTWEWVH